MKIGIIGGSGLYDIEGLEAKKWVNVTTPFGKPSDQLLCGRLALSGAEGVGGRDVVFLPRHARGHRILPGELNHRANIWALKKLGVSWILSVSAVGSLQEKYRPLDIVLPDQFFDRTKKGLEHTFFGKGIVAHTSFAEPLCKILRETLRGCATEVLRGQEAKVHFGGAYVNMEGPMFSTKAESGAYRQMGFDIIGMTNLGEAKLAREAEMCYASMAMITDYDCWHVSETPVTGQMVVQILLKNVETAKKIVQRAIGKVPIHSDCSCKHALAESLVTDKKLWPAKTKKALAPILKPYLR